MSIVFLHIIQLFWGAFVCFVCIFTLILLPRVHLYAFLRGARSPELLWGPFVCFFTWCTLAWEAFLCIFTWCTLARAPLGTICMHFYVVYTRLGPLGTICMHFYVVYTCLGSPGDHLYAFLHGVHSPGLPWESFVCIFTWCTLAWAPLGGICMHFYIVYTRLGSPGGHLYAFLRGEHSPGLPWAIVFYVAL